MKIRDYRLEDSHIIIVEYILIFGFCLFPMFMTFPYRINIFLSWEGAYRLYLGQIPYRDFGIPMGFGYWIIPAIFFKILGPSLITLVKAQAFINILSAFSFRSILRTLGVCPPVRALSILLFLISFSFVNFWPWYNHTVIVFELIGIAFVLKYIFRATQAKWPNLYLVLAAFFLFMSIFTKQDAGAFAFLIGLLLVVCNAVYEKKIKSVLWFLAFYILIAAAIIVPFIPYNIGYWINYGQPPHYDRLSFYDIFDIFFGKSEWIKFYLMIIVLILMYRFQDFKSTIQNKKLIIFSLLATGILVEAAVFQVTSYVPEYNNIFFHSFSIAYIFSFSGLTEKINFKKCIPLSVTGVLILLWWSSRTWQYTNRIIGKYFPHSEAVDTSEVSLHTFIREEPGRTWNKSLTPYRSQWKFAPWTPFKKISMPVATIHGINKILEMPIIAEHAKPLKVLNMTELTPLAAVIGFTPEIGADIPMWYHKNVAMYEKEIKAYDKKIKDNYYDLVLFEYIPILNNFYPFEIRDNLNQYYQRVNTFPAPRSADYGIIEVYVKK